MLSYQHAYHAGNLADVHKHALLSAALDYLTRKDKPLSYLETHAGRGLYRLDGAEAHKTGEAEKGIGRVAGWFDADHPYARARAALAATHGPAVYPGSPLIAAALLRQGDPMTLAELHPAEIAGLRDALRGTRAQILHEDGLAMALSRCPPAPRRGLALIDPSYEVKAEYDRLPAFLQKLHRKWPVGVVMLWYPILASGAQARMARALRTAFPEALSHEVGFPPARQGHGMIGSGVVMVNPPWPLGDEAARLSALFATL